VPSRPIGIFDSGIGGLTVFREIARILPHEDLVYLGDTARVPYGTKSAATVRRYALQNLRLLMREEVKMAVIACNTASAFALSILRETFPIPVVGVIEPGCIGALRATRSRRIGIIGTEGTITSRAYERSLRDQSPDVFIATASCPLFVPLAEEGWWEGNIAEEIAHRYLRDLVAQEIDTLILGCTHYPLLKKTIAKIVGPEINLIDSAEETAGAVVTKLDRSALKHDPQKHPRRTFFVTDSPERFRKLGRMILQEELPDVHHVEI
jgi:glutamate racemase